MVECPIKRLQLRIYVQCRTPQLQLNLSYLIHTTDKQKSGGGTVDSEIGSASASGGASGGASDGATGGGEAIKVAPLMVDGKPHLPFQLQIQYTAQDGSRCMRVISQAKPITTQRNIAEKGLLNTTIYYIARKYVV